MRAKLPRPYHIHHLGWSGWSDKLTHGGWGSSCERLNHPSSFISTHNLGQKYTKQTLHDHYWLGRGERLFCWETEDKSLIGPPWLMSGYRGLLHFHSVKLDGNNSASLEGALPYFPVINPCFAIFRSHWEIYKKKSVCLYHI